MKVVVVGGGFAGFAAAVALQEARHTVTVVERRGILGGRAISFRDAALGEDVDNGTHLMVGAYRETLDLLARCGAQDLVATQENLAIDYRDREGPSALRCPPLPAPLHLLFGVLGLRLPWRVRFEACRFATAVLLGAPPEGSLASYFARTGQGPEARRLLWDPLATAILNETPEGAAAILFHRVFKEAFLTTRRASSLVFVRVGWARVVDAIADYFIRRGGRLLRRAKVESLLLSEGRIAGVALSKRPEDRDSIARGMPPTAQTLDAEAVILAVPWYAVPELVPGEHRAAFEPLLSLGSSPIVGVDMWLDRTVVEEPMVGLRGEEMEWVFDKGRLLGRSGPPQHLSFVVSAAQRSAVRKNAELAASAEGALRRLFPGMAQASVLKTLILREPHATFRPTAEHEALRPGPRTAIGGLFLAGDWTKTGLPATIEGAVQSGRRAARALEGLRDVP